MISKNKLLILFLISHFLSAQENAPSVTLVANSFNKANPFYDVLIMKDKSYIYWLYFHCKGKNVSNQINYGNSKPLIFSFRQDTSEILDTIQNCIHPKLYESEREQEWKSEIPLYGSFPKYINFHLTNDPNFSSKIDISIQRSIANVKMYVLNEEGELVSTIVHNILKQGSHRFHWFSQDIKSGTYLIFTEIDAHLTIHSVRVVKNWFENIFSRGKDISHTKRIITTDYESLDIPEPEGDFHYIHMDRHGTSLGLNLLSDTKVKMELFTIQGKYITTVQDRKFPKGKTEFFLDPFVKKQGWYLVKLTKNDKTIHIRINIKK